MGKTRSVLVMASMVALGFSPAAVMAQPFPGGLPACLEDINQCKADLDACRTARSADADGLATCTTNLSASADLLATCTTSLNTCNTDLGACTAALDACQAAGPATVAQLLATGQTACWSSGGALIPCAGTGQDGEVQAGTPLSYIDNGDGTVTDRNTKLIWEKKSRDGSPVHDVGQEVTWAQAFAHVATLNTMAFAGYRDWRLPNVRELHSIVDYGQSLAPAVSSAFNNNCGPGDTPTIFTGSCTAAPSIYSSYWTSTTVARAPGAALAVIFWDGLITEISTTFTGGRYVRAVRGGP
jgi:hypothetical protein